MRNALCCASTIVLDGQCYDLKLTLDALAKLEAKLNVSDLMTLVTKFTERTFSSQDIIEVLNAGLYGGGYKIRMEGKLVDGGPVKAAEVAMFLLASNFSESQNAIW